MIVGIPKEVKDNEYRVSLTPSGVHMLVESGHRVLVEEGAGVGSGFADGDYEAAGATIEHRAAVFKESDLIVKVKEPVPREYNLLHEGQLLFTYLHLAANEELTRVLLEKGVTAIGYETVELPSGFLPLLAPMSEIAGRMAVQVAAHYLEKENGGAGKLLGGVPSVAPCNVVILGAGMAGTNAAQIALGMGARVTLFDKSVERLRQVSTILHGNLVTLATTTQAIAEAVKGCDVVIGAALVPGARAPRLVTREMVRTMQPGSVIVDVSVDQGGCIETTRPTTHAKPVYTVDDVIHYAVTNMPGAVPHTSTYALTNVTLPYVLELCRLGFPTAVRQDKALAKGVNICCGRVTEAPVAELFGLPYVPLEEIVS